MAKRIDTTDYRYEVLRLLSDGGWLTLEELRVKTGLTKRRLNAVLASLDKDELLDWENADTCGVCLAFTIDGDYRIDSIDSPLYSIRAAEAFVVAVKQIYKDEASERAR